jgi:diacylglycerol kinase family enzyme
MRILVINNISSGHNEGTIYDFVRAFNRDGDEVVMRTTDGHTRIEHMLDDAESFDLVVASGGDGTVTTVLHRLRNTGTPVLPFPAGTANLLTLNLEQPTETHALAQLARNGQTLDFDLAELETSAGTFGFSIMSGIGYDASIMQMAEAGKEVFGELAYFLAAGANLEPQHADIKLDIDGKVVNTDGIGVIFVNFSKIQFDLSLTHNNQPRDGKLDVVILKAKHAVELLPVVFAAMRDRDGSYPGRTDAMEIYSGRQIKVVTDPPLSLEYDGEPLDVTSPVTARILPGAACIVVDDDTRALFS